MDDNEQIQARIARMNAAEEEQRAQQVARVITAHVRKPIRRGVRGSGFYKVQLSAADNGSQTLCGASPTDIDYGYGDFAQRRADTDWDASIRTSHPNASVCQECLSKAAEIKQRRAERRSR